LGLKGFVVVVKESDAIKTTKKSKVPGFEERLRGIKNPKSFQISVPFI